MTKEEACTSFVDLREKISRRAKENLALSRIISRLRWLRFRRGSLSFTWPFPRLWSSSITNSSDFLLLFGSGRSAPSTFPAFLTQLLLAQISPKLFISKTAAQTGSSNCEGSCDLHWPLARCHVPWTFV
jgi:hypothetical protein